MAERAPGSAAGGSAAGGSAAKMPSRGRLGERPVRPTRVRWPVKFVALAFIWGSSFLLMKIGLRSLAPVQISSLRIFSGTAVLAVLLTVARGRLPRDRRVWAHLVVSGFFLGALPFSLFALGEERVSSALAGIGNSTTPIATVLFSLLLLPSDHIGRRKVLGIIVGFLGVLVILQPWEATGRPDLVGFGMTLVAGASYGFGWTYSKRFAGGTDPGGLSLPTAQLLVASAQMLLILGSWWLFQRGKGAAGSAVLAAPWSLNTAPGSSALGPVLAVLALGVVGTGIAFSFQYDVMREAGPTVGASVTYVIPVVSVALGVLLLDERLAWPQIVGAAIVVSAAVLIGRPPRRRTA